MRGIDIHTGASSTRSPTAPGQRAASDMEVAEAADSTCGSRRRESQIGPTDPVPTTVSRNQTMDGFARPGPSPYQREVSTARTRTFGWAENVMSQTDGKLDTNSRAGPGGEEAKVSLPGIKELFTMAGEVESGKSFCQRQNDHWPVVDISSRQQVDLFLVAPIPR